MEGKIKKLLLITGSVMSATVALLPLTSYASTTQPVTGPVPGISEQGYAHGMLATTLRLVMNVSTIRVLPPTL